MLDNVSEEDCFGVNPIQRPKGGTIVIYNVEDVATSMDVNEKETVLKDLRCDGYSWGKCEKTVPCERGRHSFHYSRHKDEKFKINKAFKRIEVRNVNISHVLFHYVGDEEVAPRGVKHGNGKDRSILYVRTSQRTKADVTKMLKVGLPSHTVYENVTYPKDDWFGTRNPRDLKYVQNVKQNASSFSHNSSYVVYIATS
uniref:PARP catalytic domain-containing protein n=1 Tax=Panagrellus redivivus TaxID=6233 RepID=A0A7E4VYE8_PANRE